MSLACIGGVLFKVYIVGDAIRVVRRFSLPNVDAGDLSNNAGVFRFPRVSCAAANAEDADLDPNVAGKLPCLGLFCVISDGPVLHSLLKGLLPTDVSTCSIRTSSKTTARDIGKRATPPTGTRDSCTC